MSSTPEAVVKVTLYQVPSDRCGILRAKDEIIAKLTADLNRANADKECLQAQITQQVKENDILHNTIDDQAYKIGELKVEVSGQNSKLAGQEREIEALETQLVIYQRVIDEDNVSRRSDSSCTDYDLMDLTSDEEEEEEDFDQDNSISSTTDKNGSDTFGASNIKPGMGEAMEHN
ncbi:hypothetical protein FGADI_12659 [Fusarium gaditjirri]|uniref:Uncharacterized protein n=1 Tax=Fusarium gaditjirri TaxID=282569 RepID=A0A8H4SRT1_9HYPO|nr:hypothetical protein FGADI_12659 [Fusarium gaditjirri]